MKQGYKLIVLSLLCFAGSVGFGKEEPAFGRYIGVLKHEKLGKEQLAKLDFIVSRTSENELELKAILTLHFGDFKSGEYVSYHYDKVRYNVLTGSMVFEDTEQPLSVIVKRFGGGKLVGDVTSLWAGKLGQIVLDTEKTVTPQAPLIEPIWGEYSGNCGYLPTKLQLYTYRSTQDSAHTAQPFGAYSIRANMPIACQDGNCSNLRFTSGSYNFLAKKKQLSLVGPRMSMACDVDGDDLSCKAIDSAASKALDLSSCVFHRTSKETAAPRQFSPVVETGVFGLPNQPVEISAEQFTGLQSGEYRGYVFHEYSGKYQAASLDISVYQLGAGAAGGTKISSNARLYFGDHDSTESIPYRFGEFTYPNPITGPKNVVFSRMGSNLDAVVRISESKDGVIKGTWYSVIFGKVGPFELRKNGLPSLPPGAKRIEPLSGVYQGASPWPESPDNFWVIRLQIVPGISPPTTSENPFFPNLLRGSMFLNEITKSYAITDGSYDFYTGRLGFIKAADEGPEHGWIGSQASRDELRLHHVPLPPITPVPKHRPESFKLVE